MQARPLQGSCRPVHIHRRVGPLPLQATVSQAQAWAAADLGMSEQRHRDMRRHKHHPQQAVALPGSSRQQVWCSLPAALQLPSIHGLAMLSARLGIHAAHMQVHR